MPPKKVALLEEYRLIERSEYEINGAWKGAHILLFFLAFIFGCFCTFCFHMLMFMFDEKCVLFPKLQSLTSLRHNVIYEFVPTGTDAADLPVDFLSTQWVEKSACYLPTYVPLVSGIFGLVWTTMFLMCSTGSRTLSGLQRPWRILPPVFIFSLAMGGICIYSSSLTHNGLEELCLKLSEITGSPTCSYTVNVATLVYERRIRGVYQATRLTILSAWLHTSCWLLSAVLALVRVVMVVDFQLVRVNVDLIGDTEKMLENEEAHVRTVSPDRWIFTSDISLSSTISSNVNRVQFKNKTENEEHETELIRDADNTTNMMCMLYYDEKGTVNHSPSDLSLVPEERSKLARQRMLVSVDKEHFFIAKMVLDLVDNLSLPMSSSTSLTGSESPQSLVLEVVRQFGHSRIVSLSDQGIRTQEGDSEKQDDQRWSIDSRLPEENSDKHDRDQRWSDEKANVKNIKLKSKSVSSMSKMNVMKSSQKRIKESVKNKGRDSDEGTTSNETVRRKSNLKHVSIQTDQKRKKILTKKSTSQKVQISEPKSDTVDSDTSSANDGGKTDKKSQTKKEKQD